MEKIVSLAVAFGMFGFILFVIDFLLMRAQGLTLIFQG